MNITAFKAQAQKEGVTASYSGNTQTVYIKGEDSKVKRFIRLCCLKGTSFYPFKFAQG